MGNAVFCKRVGLACCATAVLVTLAGCTSRVQDKTLVIRWQRLVDDKGDTCDRCGNTERSIDEAARLLAASLKPLGMRVQVVKAPLTDDQFKQDPRESNRIWIGDSPLEEIIDAKTGDSPCCGSCGDSNCRTMIVDGRTYETIPSELIVRAGLRTASNLLQPAAIAEPCCKSSEACCESNGSDLQPMPWKTGQEVSIKELPVTCTLKSEDLAERKKVLDELTRGVVERRDLGNGMAYRFEPKPGVVTRLARAIELERACCHFLDFRINVGQADGPVWLELRGPAGAKELIEEYFARQ